MCEILALFHDKFVCWKLLFWQFNLCSSARKHRTASASVLGKGCEGRWTDSISSASPRRASVILWTPGVACWSHISQGFSEYLKRESQWCAQSSENQGNMPGGLASLSTFQLFAAFWDNQCCFYLISTVCVAGWRPLTTSLEIFYWKCKALSSEWNPDIIDIWKSQDLGKPHCELYAQCYEVAFLLLFMSINVSFSKMWCMKVFILHCNYSANTINRINAIKNWIFKYDRINAVKWRLLKNQEILLERGLPVCSGRCRFVAMNEFFPRDCLCWIIYTCTSAY